jgi:hypothetical protein
MRQIPFAHLYHRWTEYDVKKFDAETVLMKVIKQIVADITKYNKSQPRQQHVDIMATQRLRLLVGGGGGVDDRVDLIRDGLLLLNKHIDIPQFITKPEHIHLYTQLKDNVVVLPPITYLQPDNDDDDDDDDETQGK